MTDWARTIDLAILLHHQCCNLGEMAPIGLCVWTLGLNMLFWKVMDLVHGSVLEEASTGGEPGGFLVWLCFLPVLRLLTADAVGPFVFS